MFDFQQMYREKLRTPEAAVECVKDGDWVDYTSSLGNLYYLTGHWQSGEMSCTM